MSKVYLQMKYHPAKKEVEFRRFQNGKELPVEGGRLKSYMNKKGQFVLQDHGKKFFSDIAYAFDSIKSLEMHVITTKIDYEDLLQMIEYYNKDPETKCQINPTLIAELPDMKEIFAEIVKYGEQAIGVLEKHRLKLFDTNCITNETVKKSAESFASQINEEAKNIREKIDSMGDNNVSLCFTGVYSAGKSALINSLLGYRILPEKITSETAKMFLIRSPKEGEKIEIIFDIDNVKTVLTWVEKKNFFEITEGPVENDERADIQNEINRLKDESFQRHEQIAALLTKLNSMDAISHNIEIRIPVPLDSESVQFTIYDTPGTDSNYVEHQDVLMDALSEQKQSILIFVAAPNKTEGTGNNALLRYLKEAELKDSKTSIDLGRSLFVINWSDSIDSDERKDLQSEEIKYKNEDGKIDFSIKLSDKKLFFTSAKMAYAAKAKRNGVATKKEESVFSRGLISMQDEYAGFCYRENRCAASEFATNKMHERCEEALEKAKRGGDDISVLEICSGIYALEREIIQYGEKYASAVKAFAIIDSVNKALTKLSNRANSLKESNREDISKIQRNIDELRETINHAIEDEYNKKAISENAALPEETLQRLKLDKSTLQKTIIGNVESYMDDVLKGRFFGRGKVKFKKKDNEKIRERCNQVIRKYTDDFLKTRKTILESERDDFIEKVKSAIMENGEISDSAKKFFLDIPAPKVDSVQRVRDLGDIYDDRKSTEGKWIFKTDYLDKSGFKKDVKGILLGIVEDMSEKYRKDYKNALEILLMQIKINFETNLETYSLSMQGLKENKDAMMELGGHVADAAAALKKCEEELNEIIWREV